MKRKAILKDIDFLKETNEIRNDIEISELNKNLEKIPFPLYFNNKVEKILLDFENEKKEENIIKLIEQYIDEASNYFNITIEYCTKKFCSGCKCKLDKITNDQCGKCGITITKFVEKNAKTDLFKKDEGIKSLIKVFYKLQGMDSEVNFSDKMILNIRSYLSKKGIVSENEKVSSDNEEQLVKVPGTNVEIMKICLYKCGYKNYYNDIHYICKIIWGWQLPNLQKYENILIKHYCDTQVFYNECKGNRKSDIRNWYRLYYSFKMMYKLKITKWNCKETDFKGFSLETSSNYEKILIMMYNKSGLLNEKRK